MLDGKTSRVLIIHNDLREASALQCLVEKGRGFSALSTWSGLEALDLLKTDQFDVLLIDSYVPDLYVGELIERVSSLPRPPQILVMGDRPTPAHITQCAARGLCCVVDKGRPHTILQAMAAYAAMRKPANRTKEGDSPKASRMEKDNANAND
ncbi:MAG: response regulator [Candidatus Acidiferrales bacterium]|jgi:CheY-like chemotaxis protein